MAGIVISCDISVTAQAQQAPPDAIAGADPAGEYVHSQRELVAGLRLNADGSFLYGLTVGSLDERAQGRWKRVGDTIELTSDPRPVPPAVTAGPVTRPSRTGDAGAPFAIRLTANGRDVPGVDLRIEFDRGEPLESYTPGDAWPLPAQEKRAPRFVTFALPSYRLQSPRFAIDGKPGTVANFVLAPNDFGVADLTGVRVEIEQDALVLHRDEGSMRFTRVAR